MWRVWVFALALSVAPAAAADFPFGQFAPHTFADLLADQAAYEADAPTPRPGDRILRPALRAKVSAQFVGTHRPLGEAHKTDISKWATAYRAQTGWAETFGEEYLFRAEGREWWLPVQNPVAAFFPRELREGDTVELYVIYGGATYENTGWYPLILVEEFRTGQ